MNDPFQLQNQQAREELNAKRQELVEWERGLLEKSRQMEEAVQQFNAKSQKMSS